MSKLYQLIDELCPNGVEYVKLNTVCKIYDGTHSTPAYTSAGIKFVSVQNINNLYETDKYISIDDFKKYKNIPQVGDVLMTRIGSIGICAVVDRDEPLAYYVSLALLKPNKAVLNGKYLKYAIESSHVRKELRKRTLVNAVPIKINKEDIGKIIIPIPPIPIQEEIVRILDDYTELTKELTAKLTLEIAARKQQYEYYRNSLFDFQDKAIYKPLQEIADIGTGSSNTNEELEEGKYPFFVRSQEVRRKNTYEFDETAIITSGDGVGVGKIFHYIEGKYALHQRAYRIHIIADEVLPKYCFHYMKNAFLPYIEKNSFHSSVTSIRRPMLNNFPVPIPSIPEQQRIVGILECFEKCSDDIKDELSAEIESRKKQYNYYRDKLLTFKKKEVTENE